YQKRNDFMQSNSSIKNKNFTPLIIGLTIFINGLIALLFFIPKSEKEMGFDVHFLPKLNAVFNAFTFIFLLAALIFILRKYQKMNDFMQSNSSIKNKNFTPLIIGLTIFINGLIALLFFIPKSEKEMGFDVHFLPKLNAVFNAFTFIFLLAALIFILRKNVKMHRNFIFAAFTTTFLFLITYLTYHYIAPSTSYGGDGILQKIYYFVLITHITLAPVVVALALFSLTWALTNKIDKHRK